MDIIRTYFGRHPSQQKVAKLLLEHGISVRDGRAYCGEIEQADCSLGRACGVDRRVVKATLVRISSIPETDEIFSKLRSTLSMVDLAPVIGCSSIIITPTDSTMPGILADVTSVLYRHDVSVRQAMVDDSGDEDGAKLVVVAYGRIPSDIIPELKSCRGVDSVIIK